MVQYDKIYVLVYSNYCHTLRMIIFENFLLDGILLTLRTKHHMIKAGCAQTKSGNGAIGYRRIIPFCGICLGPNRGLTSLEDR